MKPTPTDFRRWQIHIRKECVNCDRPDRSETIKPWSVNWTLLGRILQAKNACLCPGYAPKTECPKTG